MMSKAAKGGSRKRVEKKPQRFSVPITTELAAKLKAAAKGRADHAPLLLQSDGSPWGDNPGAELSSLRQRRSSLPSGSILPRTMYSLRHSSIVRHVIEKRAGPVGGGAAQHIDQDDRKALFEYITEHSDDISRHALLQHEPPSGENVVALAR